VRAAEAKGREKVRSIRKLLYLVFWPSKSEKNSFKLLMNSLSF